VRIGIVGLPGTGKTTLFNLFTGGHASTSSWGGGRGEAHIGVARVPDARLDRLAEILKPAKTTYATVEYVDLPGLHRGQSRSASGVQAQEMTSYLNSLKNVDALMHVVRAFHDPLVANPEAAVDPRKDIDLFELEMIFSDLGIIEKRLERLAKDLKKAKSADLELENAVLERCRSTLEQERPLREMALSQEEEKRVKGFTFLSAKPILIVLNLDDKDAPMISNIVEESGLQQYASRRNTRVTALCGRIEAEIADLSPEDANLFLEDLGLSQSGLARMIQESYALLGLFSFYTAGDPEARAWTIPHDTTAQQAAGIIHTDMAKGFIKAEVISYDDMVALGSFQAAKSKGVLRLEGKEYVVREGDVILFRFNV
jgi:GTP-binding protein YchF